MGFFEPEGPQAGPISIPSNLDLTPQSREDKSVFGAAFRQENPIASALSSFDYDPLKPFDPNYRPWEDIQGTYYEQFADRFAGARDREDVTAMKGQIDREMEDRKTLDAAGGWGYMAQFGAALLSPTTLLPGGAIVKGGQGVRIGLTGLKVAGWSALAASIDEAFLQSTQQTRSGAESALGIGGAFILGGLLGAGFGKLGAVEAKSMARDLETALTGIHGYVETSRSVGAAAVADQNFKLRNEGFIQAIKDVPVLRTVVQSDPLIRLQTAESQNARMAIANLAESPSVYQVNEGGLGVLGSSPPVEALIKLRKYTDEVAAVKSLRDTWGRYYNDGNLGVLGNMTGPITRAYSNLAGKQGKLSFNEYLEEVGKAMFAGDAHPIPQVAEAAAKLRDIIFRPMEKELMDLGILPPDFKIKYDEGYFTRMYNAAKIDTNWRSGGNDDLFPVLVEEFTKNRDAAAQRLQDDLTVDQMEAERFQHKETMRQAQGALDRARRKATEKRDRARAAVGRQGAVGRATGALRRAMKARSDDLRKGLVEGEDRQALAEALREARSASRLRPEDILQAIRRLGGISDPRVGGRWTGKGWKSETPTELERMLDTKASSIRREGGREADYMREALIEEGFLPEGATINDMMDAIKRSADGEDVFAATDLEAVARYEAARDFRNSLEELGVDVSKSIDEVVKALPDAAKNQKVMRAKSKEAKRSSEKAGAREENALAGVEKALQRLDDALERIRYLDEEVAPKVKEEIKAARQALADLMPKLKDAKAARSEDEILAAMDQLDIENAVDEVRNSIVGLKAGDPHFMAALPSPVHARVLDVPSSVLLPWLKTNAQDVTAHYMHSVVPRVEMMKRFGGDADMTAELKAITDEYNNAISALPEGAKKRTTLIKERDRVLRDVAAQRDRLLGRYGIPDNPKAWWVTGGRIGRAISYPAFLGNMVMSAVPDMANLLRNGMEAALTIPDFVRAPRRFFSNTKDMAEMVGAAEWYLNGRAQSIYELFDPFSSRSGLENALAESGRMFSVASGMIPWNVAWKTMGAMMGSSRLSKAVLAAAEGKATKRQLRLLGEGYIDGAMIDRIAAQLREHADMNGPTWAPRGALWTDKGAYDAFRVAMNREVDLQVITPGLDVPLTFSNEGMKFFLQFKRFAFSMHHRFLLAGISRADAEFASQAALLILLGGFVSSGKAYLSGYEQKHGAEWFVDAIDRSGVAGWLMEAYNMQAATGIVPFLTGGRFDGKIGDDMVSRYQARSKTYGMLGPTVDMAAGFAEGAAGLGSETGGTWRDVRKIMRPIPGNNAYHLQWIFKRVEDALVEAFDAKPRP